MLKTKAGKPETSPQKTRKRAILLVDDHPLFRKGWARCSTASPISKCAAKRKIAAARSTLSGATHLISRIVDIGLRGSANGIELMKSMKAEQPELPVLMVSMYDEALYAERALRAGARGYVMKREALDCVLGAIRDVLRGEIYISPAMSKRMIFDHIHRRRRGALRGGTAERSGAGGVSAHRRRARHARDRQ
jgi:DNA-binding NarL/FixJ family response regulator